MSEAAADDAVVGTVPLDDQPPRALAGARHAHPVRVLNLLSRLSRGGGIPNVVRELVLRADSHAFEHHVCQLRPIHSEDLNDTLLRSARIHSLRLPSRDGQDLTSFGLGSIRFARLVRQIRPDVVHVHTGTSLLGLAARLSTGRRAAWLLDFHEPIDVRHSRRTTRAVHAMVHRLGFAGVTHSTAVTAKVQTALPARVPLFRIPLGVDTAAYRVPRDAARSWKARHGFDPDAVLVTSIGRLAPLKGSRELLEIAGSVLQERPAVEFAFIGKGPLREELTDRASAMGVADRVRFLGFVDDLPTALAAADIYLSASHYEGFGITVLEAMAGGLPVVATRIDGLVDLVVDGETGWFVEREDVDGYVARLIELIDDPSVRERLGRAARSRAEREFDIGLTVRAYEQLYLELSARTRGTLKPARD